MDFEIDDDPKLHEVSQILEEPGRIAQTYMISGMFTFRNETLLMHRSVVGLNPIPNRKLLYIP